MKMTDTKQSGSTRVAHVAVILLNVLAFFAPFPRPTIDIPSRGVIFIWHPAWEHLGGGDFMRLSGVALLVVVLLHAVRLVWPTRRHRRELIVGLLLQLFRNITDVMLIIACLPTWCLEHHTFHWECMGDARYLFVLGAGVAGVASTVIQARILFKKTRQWRAENKSVDRYVSQRADAL